VELDELYCSANVVPVIKSRRIRWTVNVPRVVRDERGSYRVEGKKPF